MLPAITRAWTTSYPDRVSLADKLILVTGASGGIGEAIARRCAAEGAQVVAVARREDRLTRLAAETGAIPMVADLSEPEQVAALCQRVLTEVGVPDIIVNNAGAGRFSSIEETSVDEAHAQMSLPYFAAFNVTRGFIEPMLARGSGVVFQINSPVAVVPWPGSVGYAAARFALRGFTEALRQDLWGTGIQVGSLMPTRVHSEYFEANPGSIDRVPRVENMVGSMTPDEVAKACVNALTKRPGKDTCVPWRWGLIAPVARAFPGALAALYRATGHRRR